MITFTMHGLKPKMREVSVRTAPCPFAIEPEAEPGFMSADDPRWKEMKVRVRSALADTNAPKRPSHMAVVSGVPFDRFVRVTGMDLPIAVEIVRACSDLEFTEGREVAMVGELSLSGEVCPVPGILPMMLAAAAEGIEVMVIPGANQNEAFGLPSDCKMKVVPVSSLWEAVQLMTGDFWATTLTQLEVQEHPIYCMDDVRGQDKAKQEIKQAIADGKSILLVGHPGAGKTMLARRIHEYLPEMPDAMKREVAEIYSTTGLLRRNANPMDLGRPFRAPHHTISTAALMGGGTNPRPGEVTLAHNGILFLDEVPEFTRDALENVQRAYKNGKVLHTRRDWVHTFPSKFVLVGAMNPCPCGYVGDQRCQCTPGQIERYRNRVRGMFDVVIEVPAVKPEW